MAGFELWVLLATDITSALVAVILFYLWKPVWKARLGWSAEIVRAFLHFGKRNVWANFLQSVLDRIDDQWTRIFLGSEAMGFYSRAYTVASYPRLILASPVNEVALGVYAELKDQRAALSQAFVRINGLLVRFGFLMGGALALIAPEFIRILLGDKWLPSLIPLRLLLVFTLLNPIKITLGNLFVAVGAPEKAAWARLLQLPILLIGLFTLGQRANIVGVAIAVDIMLLVGIGLMLLSARQYVDFSVLRLFGVPLFALALALAGGRLAILLPTIFGSDWRTGIVKLTVFSLVYGILLLVFERHELTQLLQFVRNKFA